MSNPAPYTPNPPPLTWAHHIEVGQEGGGVKAAPRDALDAEGQAVHAQDLPLCGKGDNQSGTYDDGLQHLDQQSSGLKAVYVHQHWARPSTPSIYPCVEIETASQGFAGLPVWDL